MLKTILTIVALLLAAFACLLAEVLTPSFGVLALLAAGAMVWAIWLAFGISSVLGVVTIVLCVVLVPIYWNLLVKLLPKTPLGKRVFLTAAEDGTGQGTPEAQELEALVGKTGTADTSLRPAGAVRIDGNRYVASAESGFIEKGQPVRVVRSEGMNLVVRSLPRV